MAIEKVAVLGGGLMGSGIAEAVARAGLPAIVRDVDDVALGAVHKRLRASLERAVAGGKIEASEGEAIRARITLTTELADLADADLVIEAVPENAELKAAILAEVAGVVSERALIASNTSSIPIAQLAAGMPNPQRVLGLHFFSPVPVMGLVEIVVALDTSEETVATAREFAARIGKQPIETGDRSGFIVNMLLVPYLMAAVRMLEEGFASRESIDEGMKLGCGHPMGPLTLSDFIGLDVLYAIGDSLYEEFKRTEYAPPPLLKRMVASGRIGRKAGRGFYEYAPQGEEGGSMSAAMGDLYEIPQEMQDFRETIRQIAVEKIAPRAGEIDRESKYPWDVRKLLAEQDILGLPFAEEYGGTGTGTLMLQIGVEEIAKACASSALILMIQELGTLPIALSGSEELKQRFLPKCASGEWSPAFALSEPEAGSDPASMRTNAVRDGDEWVINGQKSWITNASVADFYVVFAMTDREKRRISAFVVEKEREGFDPGPLEHKLGIKGSPTGSPSFTDVRVPHENLIGEEGRGLSVALGTLERTRLGAAAQAVGIAQGATDFAADYAKERIAFGKPINQLQAIQFKLADMEAGTAAARELLYKACSMADRAERPAELGKWTSMAKLIASDNAMRVTVEAIQVLGGYGYVNEYPVERMMRDAKITQIYEGTNEIQRVVIARSMS